MMPPPPPQSPRSALRAPGASSLADAAVQGTNDDATVSKLCVALRAAAQRHARGICAGQTRCCSELARFADA